MTSLLVCIAAILLSQIANAGPYTEIPKIFVKDDQNVRYTEKIYSIIKYYTVDRNTDAIKQATDLKQNMQKRQNDLQKMIDDN